MSASVEPSGTEAENEFESLKSNYDPPGTAPVLFRDIHEVLKYFGSKLGGKPSR